VDIKEEEGGGVGRSHWSLMKMMALLKYVGF